MHVLFNGSDPVNLAQHVDHVASNTNTQVVIGHNKVHSDAPIQQDPKIVGAPYSATQITIVSGTNTTNGTSRPAELSLTISSTATTCVITKL